MAKRAEGWWTRPVAWVTGAIAVAVVALVVLIVINLAAPSAAPSATPSESPTASASSTALTSETPYCKAFRTIIEPARDNQGESAGLDWDQLSRRFTTYLTEYQSAEKLAPAGLKDDYAKAIGTLKEGVAVALSRDLTRLKDFLAKLSSLNDAMDAIDTQSRELCR